VQSPSEEQDALHALPPHTYGLQSCVTGDWHAPAPSQTGESVSMPAEHERAAPQMVPDGRSDSTQEPVAQLKVAQPVSGAHSATPQQKPPTQNPVAQSWPSTHTPPSGTCSIQALDSQRFPAAQSPSDAQDVLQLSTPHAYGLHSIEDGAAQPPFPSQWGDSNCLPPLHVRAPQETASPGKTHSAPTPSQRPPHGETPTHSRPPTGEPAAAAMQVPIAQVWHVPVQSEAQQVPRPSEPWSARMQ
jgi:hypothetical protein